MIGTNMDQENLTKAKERISEFYEIIDQSTIIKTKPIGKKYTTDFHNQAIKILSDDTAKETANHFKHIENELGRSAQTNQKGEVPIDLDLIMWNGEIKRSDYEKYAFVRKCVDEIKDNAELTV